MNNYPHFKMTDREKAMPAILEKIMVEDASLDKGWSILIGSRD